MIDTLNELYGQLRETGIQIEKYINQENELFMGPITSLAFNAILIEIKELKAKLDFYDELIDRNFVETYHEKYE